MLAGSAEASLERGKRVLCRAEEPFTNTGNSSEKSSRGEEHTLIDNRDLGREVFCRLPEKVQQDVQAAGGLGEGLP